MRQHHTIFVLVLLSFGYRSNLAEQPESPGRATGYNVLIIQTDEHHFGTLGCYGGDIVATPNIDWIASHGVRCDSFYAVTPVCTPSRGSFVTGLYPQKNGVVTNNIPLPDQSLTFAQVLQERGFATGFAGKWHLDGDGKPQWQPERNFGFADNRFMFNRGHWKKLADGEQGPVVAARNENGQPTYAVDDADANSYATDWLTSKAIEFIHEHSSEQFCYYLSLPDPHGPNTVRAPYDSMFQDIEVPIPESLAPTRTGDQGWRNSNGVSAEQLRRIMPNYYGMVRCIDDNVGRLLVELRALGLLNKTIIVFTSDHGDLCGEHGRLNKGVPFEGSARIPFLLYCPETIPAGQVVSEALTTIDFFPTVLSLLDIDTELPIDGRDASLLLAGATEEAWDDFAVIRSTPGKHWLAGVSADFKIVFGEDADPWLIDRVNDPQEQSNLWNSVEHQDVIRTMAERLHAYALEHNDPYARIPEIRSALQAARQQ